jgi:hypothetical protein
MGDERQHAAVRGVDFEHPFFHAPLSSLTNVRGGTQKASTRPALVNKPDVV